MIRAFITDWGSVLMRTVDIRPRLAWERRLDLVPGDLADMLFRGNAWDRAQRGQASMDDVWEEMARRLGLSDGEVVALQQDFWAGDRLDQELVALIGDLRRHGVRTALLSNHPSTLPELLADLGLDGLFDATTVSALEGVTKPDPAIYQLTLDRLGVEPPEAVFVDDQRANVEAALRLGMAGIRFRGTPHLRRALAASGLPIENPPPDPVPGIRAVIFDWGGVFSPLTFFKHTREWEERLGLPQGTLNRVLWGREWKQLEIGAISSEEFDVHVARSLGLPDREAVRRFYQEYYRNEQLDQRVLAAVRTLRGHYRVAMLTNAFPGHAEMVRERYGFDPRAEFDVYINSAEVGLAKPDPAIYQLTLDRLGVSSGEAVFLDDMVRNTDAAQALGMHAIVFADAGAALAELASLLGLPLSSLLGQE